MNVTATATVAAIAPMDEEPQIASISQDYQRALASLEKILAQFAEQKDPLSLELQHWGLRALNTPFDEDILARVMKLIDKLRFRILADPLDRSPKPELCEGPHYDEEWIWSKPKLALWQDLSDLPLISPFNNKPLHAIPHPFAQAMCVWLQSLPLDEVAGPDGQGQAFAAVEEAFRSLTISTAPNDPNAKVIKKFFLETHAQSAVAARDKHRLAKRAKNIEKKAERAIALTREYVQEKVEECRQRLMDYEARQKAERDAMEQAHRAEMSALQARLNAANGTQKKTDEEAAQVRKEMADLQARHANLQHQYQQRSAEVEQMRRSGGGGCIIL